MEQFQPGDLLTPAHLNKFIWAVNTLEKMAGKGGARVSSGPAGISVSTLSTAPPAPLEAAILGWALNTGASDLKMYQPCGVVGQVYSGTKVEYKRFLKVRPPIAADSAQFVFCAEPIKQGNVGRVYVLGVCLARMVNSTGAPATVADIVDGQDYLSPSPTGNAQVLWEDTFVGSAVHLCLVRFPVGGSGGDFAIADVASTANLALTGIITPIDGQTISAGMKVLAKNQATASQNGLYTVAAGAWTNLGQPKFVPIRKGTAAAQTAFILSAANVYSKFGAYDL